MHVGYKLTIQLICFIHIGGGEARLGVVGENMNE